MKLTQPNATEQPRLEPYQVILRPLVTEKGMHRSTRNNQYAFEVNPQATKDDVRRAVEDLFNVKVEKVRTQNRRGKHAQAPVQAGPDQELEEGDRDARRGASDRLLLVVDVAGTRPGRLPGAVSVPARRVKIYGHSTIQPGYRRPPRGERQRFRRADARARSPRSRCCARCARRVAATTRGASRPGIAAAATSSSIA